MALVSIEECLSLANSGSYREWSASTGLVAATEGRDPEGLSLDAMQYQSEQPVVSREKKHSQLFTAGPVVRTTAHLLGKQAPAHRLCHGVSGCERSELFASFPHVRAHCFRA